MTSAAAGGERRGDRHHHWVDGDSEQAKIATGSVVNDASARKLETTTSFSESEECRTATTMAGAIGRVTSDRALVRPAPRLMAASSSSRGTLVIAALAMIGNRAWRARRGRG